MAKRILRIFYGCRHGARSESRRAPPLCGPSGFSYTDAARRFKENPEVDMELKNTVDAMLSDDPLRRLLAEYFQASIRYQELSKLLDDIEAGTFSSPPYYIKNVYENQLEAMGTYLDALSYRAELAGIPFSELMEIEKLGSL